MRTFAITFLLMMGYTFTMPAQDMTNEKLGKIFYVLGDSLNGANGKWEIWIKDFPMICLTDETHNRMRIISPVKKLEDMEEGELEKCMEANFHTALDVKYALSDDIVWVVYIHPLKELTKNQVIDALAQVRLAALTYGTYYSSTELAFPKKEEIQQEPKGIKN